MKESRSERTPGKYSLGGIKFTQLQLFKDHVRELELELDEHRIIQEAEVVIETSYRDIVTPKNEGSWGEGEQPAVMVHIGTDDVGRKRTQNVRNKYRELGWKLKSRTNRVVISGL
eukprot:g21135.t1